MTPPRASARTTAAGVGAAGARSARRPRASEPGTHGSWFVSIALVLVISTATLLVRPAFTTVGWGPLAVLVCAIVIGAAAFVRTFTGGVLWPALAGLVGFVGMLTVRLEPDSLGDVVEAWGREALLLAEQFVSDAPPFRETDAAVTALLALIGIVAMTCDLFVFGLRWRVAAVLPVLVFPVLPVVLGIVDIDIWITIWLAAAFALYLFATAWWHQRIADDRLADAGYLVDDRGLSGWFGAVGIAAAGVVIAIVASTVLPSPTGIAGLMPNPGAALSTNRANPILDLGDDLRRDEPVPVLEYATSIREGALPYLSLVTLTGLDGDREWMPADFTADATTEDGGDFPAPAGLAPDAPASTFSANIILEPGVSAYLPHPGQALGVSGLSTTYGFQAATGDLRELDDEALPQHYEYRGVRLGVSTELLNAAGTSVPAGFESLVDVPQGEAADRIRAELDRVVDPSASPLAQAEQVRAFLAGEAFTYSETAPVDAGYDGSNLDVTAAFLDARSGYCVHFSSAMAVMARMLGIPTRIQVGFTPGTPSSVNSQGQVVYQVSSDDLHAWAELWVDGYGWVPFEATPASGIGQAIAPDPTTVDEDYVPPEPDAEAGADGQADGAATEAPPEPEDTPDPTPEPTETPIDDEASGTGADDGAWVAPALVVLLLVLLVALVVLAVPFSTRTLRRASRRRRVGAGDPRAPGIAWREALDEARDHGIAIPPRAEARRQEAMLARAVRPVEAGGAADIDAADGVPADGGVPDARGDQGAADPVDVGAVLAAIERLRVAVERAAFDRPDADREPVEWADVEVIERALHERATPRRRLRAIVLPASLPSLGRLLRDRRRSGRRRPSGSSNGGTA